MPVNAITPIAVPSERPSSRSARPTNQISKNANPTTSAVSPHTPAVRCTPYKIRSASQSTEYQGVPAAVKLNGSTRGMTWCSTM